MGNDRYIGGRFNTNSMGEICMSNIVSFNDMQLMADSLVKSNFYGFKAKEQILAVMCVAQAEGKHPATVVQEYDIIQGRPALKSQAVLARFQLSGGKVQWDSVSPKKVVGTFSHPSGGTITVEWTIEMAKQAGIFRDGSGWTKYPEDMLRARVITRAVRSIYPGCILGHYSAEEVADFDKPTRQTQVIEETIKDMGKIEVVEPIETVIEPIIDDEVTIDTGVDIATIEEDIPEPIKKDSYYALLLPDGTIYSKHDTLEDWMQAYIEMFIRVRESKKIPAPERQDKLNAFRKINSIVHNRLSNAQKIELTKQLSLANKGN
jgi:hypothetical protein